MAFSTKKLRSDSFYRCAGISPALVAYFGLAFYSFSFALGSLINGFLKLPNVTVANLLPQIGKEAYQEKKSNDSVNYAKDNSKKSLSKLNFMLERFEVRNDRMIRMRIDVNTKQKPENTKA